MQIKTRLSSVTHCEVILTNLPEIQRCSWRWIERGGREGSRVTHTVKYGPERVKRGTKEKEETGERKLKMIKVRKQERKWRRERSPEVLRQ